jgi:hypothetical protein
MSTQLYFVQNIALTGNIERSAKDEVRFVTSVFLMKRTISSDATKT